MLFLKMHYRDNLDPIGRELVDNAVGRFVNLSEGLFGIFVNRMTSRRMFSCFFNSLDNTRHHASGIKL